MGLLGRVMDGVIERLDKLIDDKAVNYRRVIQQGLEIKGNWQTREIFLFGSPLTPAPEVLEETDGKHKNFCWGDTSENSRLTALAILLWFLDEREAYDYLDAFLNDFVSRLPRHDFEQNFGYEFWRNRIISKRKRGNMHPDHDGYYLGDDDADDGDDDGGD
ncbi:hypothetical protein [Methanohalophilus sp.]|uniref:hypothetical protein n=1 Tax=Methanohalophilus sp. TaxID=1966352 RepID=UPI002629312E|nr:hypothetical protein [Methanohalophilus sp.]MDK2892700.1 hypothetical protein [Methanohalophilus sp.]